MASPQGSIIGDPVTFNAATVFRVKPSFPGGLGVTDVDIAAGAGLSASKLGHQHVAAYSQPNTTATTETRTLHVVHGLTGTVLAFKAGSIVPCVGGATITVDLKKNGSSILSSVITLNAASVARVVQAATISSAGLAVGDWLEIVITATTGGGTIGTGFFCEAVLAEDYT